MAGYDEDLKAIDDRASEASEGPWEHSPERDTHDSVIHRKGAIERYGYIDGDNGGVVGSSEWIWLKGPDGDFIAASRADVPRLVRFARSLINLGHMAGAQVCDEADTPGVACSSCEWDEFVQRLWDDSAKEIKQGEDNGQ